MVRIPPVGKTKNQVKNELNEIAHLYGFAKTNAFGDFEIEKTGSPSIWVHILGLNGFEDVCVVHLAITNKNTWFVKSIEVKRGGLTDVPFRVFKDMAADMAATMNGFEDREEYNIKAGVLAGLVNRTFGKPTLFKVASIATSIAINSDYNKPSFLVRVGFDGKVELTEVADGPGLYFGPFELMETEKELLMNRPDPELLLERIEDGIMKQVWESRWRPQ